MRNHLAVPESAMSDSWQSGGCFCGRVRYRVRGEPVLSAGCTCTSCVKSSGAPYMAWVGFDRDNIEVTMGEEKLYLSRPGIRRGFCGHCGTTLSYRINPSEAPDIAGTISPDGIDDARTVYIATATLDKPERFPPTNISFWDEHIDWLKIEGVDKA